MEHADLKKIVKELDDLKESQEHWKDISNMTNYVDHITIEFEYKDDSKPERLRTGKRSLSAHDLEALLPPTAARKWAKYFYDQITLKIAKLENSVKKNE